MTGGAPLVSVVIPTYNRCAFLPEAVASVLGQTCADYELIVVDDGSTDASAAMVERVGDPRVTFLPVPHSGSPGRVRNAGIGRARGRYVAFLDSDDAWEPSKLDDQLAALAALPASRWCITGVRCVDERGAPHPRWRTHPAPPEGWIVEPLLRRRVGMSTSTLLVERSLLHEIGAFDERFVGGEDYDLCVRLAVRSPVARVPDACVRGRIHAGQFVGSGWERPVMRTLGTMARAAPTWRLRSVAATELLKVAALYGWRRLRTGIRRYMRHAAAPQAARRG